MSTIQVNSVQGLETALKTVHSGDTILLAAGTYTGTAIGGTFTGVTIASADNTHQAVLTDLNLEHASGLAFKNLEFNRSISTDAYAYRVDNSSNISFDSLNVHGTMGKFDPTAFLFSNDKNVSFTNSNVHDLNRGVVLLNDDFVTFSQNTFHQMQTSGINGAGASDVKVLNNVFTDFFPVVGGEHPDAVQFFTTGTTVAAHDITVSGNIIMRGAGGPSQGIFLRDQVGTLPYQNVTVTNNLVVGSMYNGIDVQDSNNVTISGNTAAGFADQLERIQVDNVHGATLSNNIATAYINAESTGVTETNDQITGTVTDNGAALLKAWLASHKGAIAGDATLGAPVVSYDHISATTTASTTAATTAATTTATTTSATTTTAATSNLGPEIDGTANNDSLVGTWKDEVINGGAGNDTIDGGGGHDTLVGGAGDDTYIVPNSYAVIIEQPNGGIDTVIAKGDYVLPANVENLIINNTVSNNWAGTGNELNNQLTGNSGDNLLDGQAGNDTINGGAGNDTIIGGTGNDLLTGGPGNDLFRFALHSGNDTITDFGANGDHDSIDIAAYLQAGLKPTLTEVGANAVISFSSGDSITLLGVDYHHLHATSTGWVI